MSAFLTREEATNLMRRGGLVVDVRTVEEFEEGHAEGSLNLPVHLLFHLAHERLPLDRPLLLCCASGVRSHMAVQQLRQLGFDAHNLGAWQRIQTLLS